jgi:hypothetical protein
MIVDSHRLAKLHVELSHFDTFLVPLLLSIKVKSQDCYVIHYHSNRKSDKLTFTFSYNQRYGQGFYIIDNAWKAL